MSLTSVKVTEEVWLTCLTHALSTETEEIMGLLLGDIEYKNNGWVTAHVWAAAPQTRSDRRKDRVETKPEQLAAASAQADRMTAETGKTTRVIGWYHSHPHITVMPSHVGFPKCETVCLWVDVRTQGMYQLMDEGFVGLIFSCFSEDSSKVGRIQAIAFQSQDGRHRNATRGAARLGSAISPVSDSGGGDGRMATTSSSFRQLDNDDIEITNLPLSAKTGVASSSALEDLFAMADKDPVRDGAGADSPAKTISGEEDSLGLQEAMHLSSLDLRDAEFVRKEVPLEVVPGHSLAHVTFSLSPLVDLQRILFAEEQTAYNQAMTQCTNRKGEVHPLAAIHHASTYQASLTKLLEYCLCPVLTSLWDRLQQNKLRLALLQDEAAALQLQQLASSTRGSPSTPVHGVRRVPHGGVYGMALERRPGVGLLSPSVKKSNSGGSQSGHKGSPEQKGIVEPNFISY